MENLRRIVLTGSNRGLGFELAKRLVQDAKFHIIVTSRDTSKLQFLDELKALNSQAKIDYHQLDQTNDSSVNTFIDWVKNSYGKIDVLVNNAAVIDHQVKAQVGNNLGAVGKQIFETNFFSVINLSEKFLPLLTEDGKLIVISTMLGKLQFVDGDLRNELSNPVTKERVLELANQTIQDLETKGQLRPEWKSPNEPIYSASKCLLNAYCRFSLSKQVGPKQAVLVVHPGWCKTDLGSDHAPLTAFQGTVCSYKLINELPFGTNENNGKFYDENGNEYEY